MNYLIEKSKLEFNAFDFTKIKNEDFVPALKKAIGVSKDKITKIQNETHCTFNSIILECEFISFEIENVSKIFFNLLSANTSEELQKIAEEFSAIHTHFLDDFVLDQTVFNKIKQVYEASQDHLNQEEKQILNKMYRYFQRNGALLNEEDKKSLRLLNEELAQLGLKFGENLLKSVNHYQLVVKNNEDLKGIPEGAIEAAKELAIKKGQPENWIFTLHFPSYLPLITYAQNRNLRKEIYMASSSKAFSGEFSNQEILTKMVNLRLKRAKLLGYKSHSEYVLEERMAETPQKVFEFIDQINQKALQKAKKDLKELKEFQKIKHPDLELEPWDTAFYSELLKKEKFDFDEEELRPFFQLENVIEGAFLVASKLYNINFKERHDLPVYHEEVKVYEVYDQGKVIALFYADFFPRESKQGGAWATTFQDHFIYQGQKYIPHASIVCNFTKSTATKPSLLSLEEVKTLFHEFGHALHNIFATSHFPSITGTNVFWDFVELPSQVMENWVLEKECLDLFAKHYKTKELIPASMIEKINASEKFQSGLYNLRQMTFSLLDMKWHSIENEIQYSVTEFENQVLGPYRLFPSIPGTSISCTFSHIFDGGYSAGYYSYKWAEVLDADAFDYFKKNGIFNQSIAKKFRENILEKGGSEHPMILYKNFRGQEPKVEPLLERLGLE
jgi:peptidyl-dipeptidase Dcp